MKLCKDCKHIQGAQTFGYVAICVHPEAPRNLVYGHFDASCDLMRSANCLIKPACGPEGNWWEEAPPKEVQQPPTTSPMQPEEPEEAPGFFASCVAAIFG
jgi:hypothetical protein